MKISTTVENAAPQPVRIMELRGTYKGGGGPDKTILLSAKNHSERFFVLVTYLRSPGDSKFQIGQKAKELGIAHYVEVIDKRMIDFSCLSQLSSLIREYHIQIVHAHDLKSTLLGGLLKLMHPRIKLMNTAHGWMMNNKADHIKQKFQLLLLRFFPLHIAVSQATKNILIQNGIPARNINLLYNAIDVNVWQRNGAVSTVRKEFDLPEESKIVGTVGRLSPEKDIPTLLLVAQKIIKVHPNTYFIIVGNGKANEFTYYKNLAAKFGIQNSVVLTGHRNDLRNLYASFDLFLTTSLTEGLPNTVLEAMAMEIPVVATRVGGVPELMIDNETGFLCQPGNVEDIAEKVDILLTSPNRRKKFATKARSRVITHFHFKDRLTKIEQLYVEIVNHKTVNI